jgi:FMN phosphatase YigB (HAD superfamily)
MSEVTSLIRQMVKEQNIQTVSFDVFDTLVFRRLGRPVDVFAKAYTHCEASVNLPMESAEFQELRIYAEKQAKRHCQSGEVTLEEIYQNLPFEENVRQTLKAAELLIESQYSFVSQPMLELIAELLASGKKVMLISDMYLSSEQIRQYLFVQHPQLLALTLYVSSEYRLNKSTGSLFDYLAEHLVLDRNTWLHLGDNRHSDFLVPKQQGIKAKLLSAQLPIEQIFKLEQTLFSQQQSFNSARFIAATHYTSAEPVAFNIGSLVWGPILLSFTDWVIDQTIKLNCQSILCLMREAQVFAPLIELRLQQRNITNIAIKKLYASRKSTFWAAIDTTQESWFEELVYVLVQRRGYTVGDFYRDFHLSPDAIYVAYQTSLIRDTESFFYQGSNLLKLLTDLARENREPVRVYIEQQKILFIRYYAQHIGESLANCCVVDLGNGGTIQHQIESILKVKSTQNLLLYSSDRIYRYVGSTQYSSFINAGTDERGLRQILFRSPECIEPLLVGDVGSTVGYQDDLQGTPILTVGLVKNSAIVNAFMQGLLRYFMVHHELGFKHINVEQITPLLFRYVQLPTELEAKLFTRILHQDNFGSNDAYPIVTQLQIHNVETRGLSEFHLNLCQHPQMELGIIHWPQAIITLLDTQFLATQLGLSSMDAQSDVHALVKRIIDNKWTHFSIYGAGLFFEKLLPYLQKNNMHIEYLIDRKAEHSGQYSVAGYSVISVAEALSKGCQKIVISSFAFKEEIAKTIYEQSQQYDDAYIEILSL